MYKFILSTYTKFRTVPEWYLKAANNGHAQAKLMLSGLQKLLSIFEINIIHLIRNAYIFSLIFNDIVKP